MVVHWSLTHEVPRFAFPPAEIALIADLRDIGEQLARNDSARGLVAELVRWVVERTGEAPTAMMLLMSLEVAEIPIERVALSELGLNVGIA